MITQNTIDTLTENLATELNLHDYDHLALAAITKRLVKDLIDDLTRYPSRYFPDAVIDAARAMRRKTTV